jgi:hypothetical protein
MSKTRDIPLLLFYAFNTVRMRGVMKRSGYPPALTKILFSPNKMMFFIITNDNFLMNGIHQARPGNTGEGGAR